MVSSPLCHFCRPRKQRGDCADADCDVNQVNRGGWTSLHWAVWDNLREDPCIVGALLKGGANPNIANEDEHTPCHFAKTVESLELLLDFGGDLRLEDEDGETPFQYHLRPDHLRPLYEAWTPHRMLPRWDAKAFPLYIAKRNKALSRFDGSSGSGYHTMNIARWQSGNLCGDPSGAS